MKNLSTISIFLILISNSIISKAQISFWTETFGTGCYQGQMANGVVTSNGTWTVTQSGYNAAQANVWYISSKEDGTGAGNCSDNNCTNNDESLHISSNDGLVPNDGGAIYDDGGLCSLLSICVTTNTRAESPVINCIGSSNITLSFNYILGGQDTIDNGTCWYYNGSTWSLLAAMPKTTGCSVGQWMAYSIGLPASANNNAGVKIGFNWSNNDDGIGTYPSFAIDDIRLSIQDTPVTNFTANDTILCTGNCINFTDLTAGNPTSWLWTFPGATPPSSSLQNPQNICYFTEGSFNVMLTANNSKGSSTKSIVNYITVLTSPPTPTITVTNICGSSTLSTSSTGTLLWSTGATTPSIAVTSMGTYSVTQTVNGCISEAGIVTASPKTIPPAPTVTVTNNCDSSTLSTTATGTLLWNTGATISSITVSTTGTYSVTQTISGCTSAASSDTATPKTLPPTPTITHGNDTLFCSFNPSYVSYQWYLSSILIPGATSPILIVSKSGNYSITITNSVGCTASADINYVIIPIIIKFASSDSSFCPGSCINFINLSQNAVSYQWYFPGGSPDSSTDQNPQNICYYNPGTYSVKLVAINVLRKDSLVLTNFIKVFSPPTVIINSSSLCNNEGVVTVVNPNLSYNYAWNTGQSGPMISITSTGTYTVTVTDTNSCTNTDTITVKNYSNCGGFLELAPDSAINYFDTLHVSVKILAGVGIFSTYAYLNFDTTLLQFVGSNVGSYLGGNIINTPPNVTGGRIDFGMTRKSGQPGSYGDGIIYDFAFIIPILPSAVPFNAITPDFITTLFSLSNITVYDTAGLQPSSFNALSIDSASTIIRYYVPVWPGDLNNDHIVNVSDILPIGYFYNDIGPARPNGSLAWVAQPAPLWGFNKATNHSSAYQTFADGNADGIISLADQAAVGFNLGKSHARLAHVPYIEPHFQQITGVPAINILMPDTFINSNSLPKNEVVTISIGSPADEINKLFGVSFDLFFNPAFVNTAAITTDYSNSIFGVLNTDFTKIEDNSEVANGTFSIGMTRYNNNTVVGNGGTLVKITFPITAGAPDGWLSIISNPLSCNDSIGNPITITGSADSLRIGLILSTEEVSSEEEYIKVYPNPTNGNIVIEINSDNSNMSDVKISNMLGQIIYNNHVALQKGINTLSVDLSNIDTGIYLIDVNTDKTSMKQKLIRE